MRHIYDIEGIVDDADYVAGHKIVDEATFVSEAGFGDLFQLIEYWKLIGAGIRGMVINGLPDNDTNGYQLTTAFFESIKAVVNAGTIKKIIPIGFWDMNTTSAVTVAHGLTATELQNVRSINCIIYSDIAGIYSVHTPCDLKSADSSTGVSNGTTAFTTTDIALARTPGGLFDSAGFEAGDYNRGYITIEYKPDNANFEW